MAQDSAPVTVTVKAAAGPTTTSPANERPGEPGRTGGRAEIGK
jgi:hypothetical protein